MQNPSWWVISNFFGILVQIVVISYYLSSFACQAMQEKCLFPACLRPIFPFFTSPLDCKHLFLFLLLRSVQGNIKDVLEAQSLSMSRVVLPESWTFRSASCLLCILFCKPLIKGPPSLRPRKQSSQSPLRLAQPFSHPLFKPLQLSGILYLEFYLIQLYAAFWQFLLYSTPPKTL